MLSKARVGLMSDRTALGFWHSTDPCSVQSRSDTSVQEWLDRAEQARESANKLVDRNAKDVMLQLAQFYLRQAAVAQAEPRGRLGRAGRECEY